MTKATKKIKLGRILKELKIFYEDMEVKIPKWVSKQGLQDLVIPQSQCIDEFNDWVHTEMGLVMALRVPFPRIGIKERIAIYHTRIERQGLVIARPMKEYRDAGGRRDNNFMLRTEDRVRYSDYTEKTLTEEFNNEETFYVALRAILLYHHNRGKGGCYA